MSSDYDLPEGSVLFFPEGLPGFEAAQRFVLLRNADYEPILLMQQAGEEALSVPVIPAQFVDPAYKLQIEPNDCRLLGFDQPPRFGGDVVCLLVLVLGSEGVPPRCNLFAPIVINPANLRAKQILQIGSSYPSVFPLTGEPAGGGAAATSDNDATAEG